MRRAHILALLVLSACDSEISTEPPPLQRFYFPTGIAHVDGPGPEGRLFVASSDFDRRWELGSVTALDLSTYTELLPLTPDSRAPEGGPAKIEALNLDPKQQVYVAPFAGQMAAYNSAEGLRLVVPTRSEGDYLFAIDANGKDLSCRGAADPNARDCTGVGISLSLPAIQGAEGYSEGKPRAPHPFGVALDQSTGELMITHLEVADSPFGSRENLSSYVVRTNAATLEINPQSYIGIGQQPANSVALGSRYAYMTGRLAVARQDVPVVRMADRLEPGRVVGAGIDGAFPVRDARGIVVFPDPAQATAGTAVVENQLFILGRAPDVLLVVAVDGAQSDAPKLRLVKEVPLPAEPNLVRVIPREPGRKALLAITCSEADSVALYDDEAGTTTLVSHVGSQPFDIAVRRSATDSTARLYVTNFNDGRVAVIDIPDVNAPYNAFVRAHLGPSQTCLVTPEDPSCPEVTQ